MNPINSDTIKNKIASLPYIAGIIDSEAVAKLSMAEIQWIVDNDMHNIINFHFVSQTLRSDRNFMLSLSNKIPEVALKSALGSLKEDKIFATQCIATSGKAYIYASNSLKLDLDIIELALQTYPSTANFIPNMLQLDLVSDSIRHKLSVHSVIKTRILERNAVALRHGIEQAIPKSDQQPASNHKV